MLDPHVENLALYKYFSLKIFFLQLNNTEIFRVFVNNNFSVKARKQRNKNYVSRTLENGR
jgi:hypothetical protein